MAARGCICVLIFISAVMVNGRLEKPSLNLIAELLRAPAKESLPVVYCSPTLQEQVTRYSESHSRTLLLCLQGSYLSQSDFKNEEVLEVTVFFLEIRGATQSIKAIVESIQWNTSVAADVQLPHKSKVLFDSKRTDSPDYLRWKHFLLKKLEIPSAYFRIIPSQASFGRLKRNSAISTSQLLAVIAQNIDSGLSSANSLKTRVEEASRLTGIANKRIKKLSSTLDSTSADIAELDAKGNRVEKLLTSIEEEMTALQSEKQDLEYNIDDFKVQLNAANVSHEHQNKGPLYHVSFSGDGYAMLESPVYGTSFSFSIIFKTTTPDGLLLFSSNSSLEYWYSYVMVKGKLVFRYKLADGVVEYESATANMNDDKWHRVDGVKTTGSLQFYVDAKLVAFNSVKSLLSPVTWGPLYIGGVPDRPFYQSQGISITSFTGCLENVTINQKLYDFRNSIGLKNTGFNCTREEEKPVTIKPYYFNGNGYASYKLPNGEVGRNFTMKLQFKTTKKEGILFSASSNKLNDALALEMKYGKLLYYLDNGDGSFMVQYNRKKLNDNKWHTILAEKQGNSIRLTVDDDSPEAAQFDGNDLTTNTNALLYIGGLPPRSRIPDGLTTDTKFLGCLLIEELMHHKCKLVQLQECNS